jgi:hypothetical protein
VPLSLAVDRAPGPSFSSVRWFPFHNARVLALSLATWIEGLRLSHRPGPSWPPTPRQQIVRVRWIQVRHHFIRTAYHC